MASYSPLCTSFHSTAPASSSSTHCLLRRLPLPSSSSSLNSFPTTTTTSRITSISLVTNRCRDSRFSVSAARNTTSTNPSGGNSDGKRKESERELQELKKKEQEEEEEEIEEELPWIQEKALDLVEFTGSVTQAIPGPRVGRSSLPWMLAVPLAYVGITFVIAFVKTVRRFNSPKEIRRKLVNKNAMLCKSIDELLEKGRDGVQQSALKGLMQKTGFGMEEILRKYIRYALNEKPFNPEFVVNLIQLRKASFLDDSQLAEILNEISRRIVKDKGPVVMDMSGYSEKGFKRKLAVQSLFGKIYYLSELPEFCSRDSSLVVKEIFGVADEDAEKLRLHTLSEAGDIDSLEKMMDDSDSEDSSDGTSNAP
ncbi:uncharacterized protein LOC130766062 [Actinidia eriantha]|uniref:uncharacterized protein LOC130766062 n=1 Tax=Actinidia eriantha TaxID=165200 RepID=UPI002587BF33|nr:uncharacterized protein LOC130766062 [Actinidia eriantha]